MAPKETKAILINAKGVAAVETVPVPPLRPDYILVRTTAVGLNPTDWKHVDHLGGGDPTGTRVGCDYAGVVEEVGPEVTKPWRKGDRVAGMIHGSNLSYPDSGAFGEYVVAKGDIALKIPDNVSDEEAATLGVSLTTVGQGLYQSLGLALPTAPIATREPVLIYGGSTGTALLGIQLARLSGYRVLTTASPRHFEKLLAAPVGAEAVFDYSSPTCAADIRAAAGGPLRLAWDCIASADTARLCAAALTSDPKDGAAHYGSLLPVSNDVVKGANANATNALTFAYTALGDPFTKGFTIPASRADFEFARTFWDLARDLLADGKLKVASLTVNAGGSGLDGVLHGLQLFREGKVSGTKMVYTL